MLPAHIRAIRPRKASFSVQDAAAHVFIRLHYILACACTQYGKTANKSTHFSCYSTIDFHTSAAAGAKHCAHAVWISACRSPFAPPWQKVISCIVPQVQEQAAWAVRPTLLTRKQRILMLFFSFSPRGMRVSNASVLVPESDRNAAFFHSSATGCTWFSAKYRCNKTPAPAHCRCLSNRRECAAAGIPAHARSDR